MTHHPWFSRLRSHGTSGTVTEQPAKSFRGFTLAWALVLQAILAIPYAAAVLLTPLGSRFSGLIYNPDDPFVYLSWMRQAAEGHWRFHNLFTLEPQRGVSFHLLFLLLGLFARVSGASLVVVYQLARGVLGILFIIEVGLLVELLEQNPRRQRWMLVLISLGSGLGWAYFLSSSPILQRADDYGLSTDLWMTETVPFLSLLLNPLFVCALCLLLGAFLCMVRGEISRDLRWSVGGGACALLLGNIHSYDILLLHGAWIAFLAVGSVRPALFRQGWPGWRPPGAWLRYACLAALTAPSVIYQWWALHVEPVFQSRANVPTLSPGLQYYLLGIGLSIPFAAAAAWKRRQDPVILWLAAWALAGLALPYVPLSFQRKLSIALDLPYLVLAAGWLAAWIDRQSERRPVLGRWSGAAMALVAALTNLCFLASVMQILARNQNNVYPMAPLYLPESELHAIDWLGQQSRPGDRVFCLPWMGNVIPSLTGDSVYVGHWGETMDFAGTGTQPGKLKVAQWFYQGHLPAEEVRRLLQSNQIRYVYDGAMEQALAAQAGRQDYLDSLPELTRVYPAQLSPGAVRIYQVRS